MPKKAPKPCKWPGCKKLTYDRFCEFHAKQQSVQYEATRETAVQRGYDTRHRKLRKIVLAEQPICQICKREPATEMDHIDGNPRNVAMENLQGLCKSCHSTKTAKEQNRWRQK